MASVLVGSPMLFVQQLEVGVGANRAPNTHNTTPPSDSDSEKEVMNLNVLNGSTGK